MADEARLIFELVDRSAGTTAPAPGAPSPGGPQPSGPSDPVGDAGQRNRPATPTPSGPAPASPVAPESPRPVSPTVQPSAQPDSRWGDLVGSLTEIAKSLGLIAILQQTAGGRIISFGKTIADLIDKATKSSEESESPPSPDSPPARSRPARSTPSGPETPRPVAPESPERSPYDNGDVIDGVATPVQPGPQASPDSPIPSGPETPSDDSLPSLPSPTGLTIPDSTSGRPEPAGYLPGPTQVETESVGPSAAMGAPKGVADGARKAAEAIGLANPIAGAAAKVVVESALLGYAAYAVTNIAAAQIAAGPVGGLSPDIARANAEQSVRELAANLLTAARIGDLIGDNVAAGGRLKAEMQELRDTFLAAVLPTVNKLKDAAAGSVGLSNDLIQWLGGENSAKLAGETFFFLLDQKFGGILSYLASRARSEDTLAENPITLFEKEPLPALPAPFAATDDMPLDQKFNPIPGLEL